MLPSDAAHAVANISDDRAPEQDVREVVAAARDLDTGRALGLLEKALIRRGVVTTWDQVCRPALVAVDEDQRHEPDCADSEHHVAGSWVPGAA